MSRLEDFEQATGIEPVRADDLQRIRHLLADGHTPTELLRLAEELRRDPARRMLGQPLLATDAAVSAFCDRFALTRTAVLEHLTLGPGQGSLLLTIIEAGRSPVSEFLLPTADLVPLATKISTRIANWTPSRPGDPLDVPRWRDLSRRLVDALGGRLRPGDEIVVIGSAGLDRLPWHLALGPHWACGYAPGWGSILLRPESGLREPTVSAFCAPRFGEAPAVETALRGSLAASRADAERSGLTHLDVEGVQADTQAMVGLLESSDFCTILCHGLIDTDASSVSLLLSADGRLPLGDSIATARSGQRHRFDWRAAAAARRSPRVIFSAACSSGLNHVRGGQQIGLFSALRHRGLRTLIAPRWDITAEQVLPVLNRSRALIVQGERPGTALRQACLEAERDGLPSWIAWSLALEGDW